jgi:hypothetical protein
MVPHCSRLEGERILGPSEIEGWRFAEVRWHPLPYGAGKAGAGGSSVSVTPRSAASPIRA